jgi:hypothetical protein
MIRKFLDRWKIKKNLPKTDDVFWADTFDFVRGKFLEKARHGLYNENGDLIFEPIYGPQTYRLKIRSAGMPYYIIQCELLAYDTRDVNTKCWFNRTSPRRILKEEFHSMILDGRVKKEERI